MGEPKELLNKEIGSEADVEITIQDAKLHIDFVYEGKGAGAKAGVFVSAEYFVEKLKKAIPGEIDDVVLDLLLAALKK